MEFQYPIVRIVKVIDGDSVRVGIDMASNIDLGFKVYLTQDLKKIVDVRLIGLDAPEAQTDTLKEGRYVQETVDFWLRVSSNPQPLLPVIPTDTPGGLMLLSHKLDHYGRSLGEIVRHHGTNKEESLNKWLLDQKFARPYDGGKREKWTAEELAPIREAMVQNP